MRLLLVNWQCRDNPLAGGAEIHLHEIFGRLAGFSAAGPGVDHVLVRGAAVGDYDRWSRERRTLGGFVLSDHPPVEVRVE